jgi:hypothetical protein
VDFIREATLIECLPYDQKNPGFALPLFVSADVHDRLVQEVDEITGKVSGFKKLEGADTQKVISVRQRVVRVGEVALHAFLTEADVAHVGTILELKAPLKEFIQRCPHRSAVLLQIAELIGTDEAKKTARSEMRRRIYSVVGERAARAFYEGATLRAALWDVLVSSAVDADSARRILRVRSKLTAYVQSDGTIELNLQALDPRDAAHVNASRLSQMLLNQFDVRPVQTVEEVPLTRAGANALQDPGVSELLRRVERTARQEERIPILLKALLEERQAALTVLDLYRDRSHLANSIISELRHKLALASRNRDKSDEEIIAELIPRIFTHNHPASRGSSLYSLARQLAAWPKINRAIRNSTDRTRSTYVDPYRTRIGQVLDGKSI